MNQDRFTQLQDLLDRAIQVSMQKQELDFSLSNPVIDVAHRKLVDLMFSCANEEVSLDEVKAAYKEWIALVASATEALKLLKAKSLRHFNEPRKCFSLGCPGLVRYSSGSGICPCCGLKQSLVNVEVKCTSMTYSETPVIEPSKVVSLAMRKKLKGSGSVSQQNVKNLFSNS